MALHQKLIDNRWRAAGTIAAVAATTVGGAVAFAATARPRRQVVHTPVLR